jgi:hypothetical protein
VTIGPGLRQFEHFSGVLVPFMRGVLRDTQAAFERANEAIKQRGGELYVGTADGQVIACGLP